MLGWDYVAALRLPFPCATGAQTYRKTRRACSPVCCFFLHPLTRALDESALRSVALFASQLSSVAESITRAEEHRRQWWQRARNHKDALLFGPLVLLVVAIIAIFICWRASDEYIARSAYETAVTLQMENPGKVYHDVRQGLADSLIREKTKGRVRDLKRLLKDAQEGKGLE